MVAMGGHDQPCGALGVGAIDSGRVADSMGTYECLLAAFRSAPLDGCCAGGFSQLLLSRGCRYVRHAGIFSIGIMIKCFTICCTETRKATWLRRGNPYEAESIHYSALEREAPAAQRVFVLLPI